MQTIIIGRHPITKGIHSDAEAFEELLKLNERLKENADAGRPVVYLMLHDRRMVKMLNTRTFADDMHRQMDVIVTTHEEAWSQHLFVTGVMEKACRGLDYENIRYDDDRTVHLVIFGTNSQAVALAETASLVAHYPNYLRDHSKRTRITFVGEYMREFMTEFIAEHENLLDNSYYRYVDVANESVKVSRPMYEGLREDFVDVEWEFVDATFDTPSVQMKLRYWAEADSQLLSVAFCRDVDTKNVSDALSFNRMMTKNDVPVYVKTDCQTVYQNLLHPEGDSNILLFGDKGNLPVLNHSLLAEAKYINYVYDFCYNNEGYMPMTISRNDAETKWQNVKAAIKRTSNLCNAMTLGTKMHTLGHREADWRDFYAISSQELKILSQIEHNRWSVEQLLHGFRPCTEEEQRDVEQDVEMKDILRRKLVHYDLRAYNDLRKDRTGQNVNIYDRCLTECIPLIANLIWKEGQYE